ncbi:glycoside hydrolase family 2 TIM barrel-domain containing protein [Lewinella sp. 4G2]|uniref:glycoside hydrolase family 2 TIM barrel-domain containing protein n=1 Tax=Lewinella sp. 4G2 TaxID=1803372 RepID=UPI0007B48091|nr:glycoside hydrolase family 2 TIM barrel-domain containing protein [Lewinella sp. 4G2]OAV45291.1 glycoside hydrolase [Lewinella sp. 4G2]
MLNQALSCFLLLCLFFSSPLTGQEDQLFDHDWRFHRGGAYGAEAVALNDSMWEVVNLPHDWSQDNIPNTDSPYSPDAESQVNGGFTAGGTGWYRKHFTLSEAEQGRNVAVRFDGVYRNAQVYLNGVKLGKNAYGYTSFRVDLTPYLKQDGENVFAVKCSNLGENSRWYSGSGIYRHVWLEVNEANYLKPWGTVVTTSDETSGVATVSVKTEAVVTTSEEVKIVSRLLDPNGQEVARGEDIVAISNPVAAFTLKVSDPELWSTTSPALYTLETTLTSTGKTWDRTNISFGIRSIEFSADEGFLLNGEPTLLKGGCIHHDNGPLGARALDRAEERKVELMKASGFNALRISHNPPSPHLLDVCDRLGILVIDEAFDIWQEPKNPQDYSLYFDEWWAHDLRSMLLRDRNHPSIIMWSIGNEIPERGSPKGVKTAAMLGDFIRAIDDSRPVTSAVNGLGNDKDPYFATLDIAGYNYETGGDHGRKTVFADDHARLPERIMYQSESYPREAFGAWQSVLDHPYVIGDFVWTAWDYLGEASIGWLGYTQKGSFFPWNLAYNGDFDICGWKRPQSYYRDAVWMEDQLSLFVHAPTPSFPEKNADLQSWSKWDWDDVVPHWNWSGYEGELLDVEVYSSCEEVALYLNDKLLERRPTSAQNEFRTRFRVPYAPGQLRAVGYRDGKVVEEKRLVTASAAKHLTATPDRTQLRADGGDLSYITVVVNDEQGTRCFDSEADVTFSISGPGEIIAVGNSNPRSTESSLVCNRKAWRGRCMVVVQSTGAAGTISVTASAPGLKAVTTQLTSTTP